MDPHGLISTILITAASVRDRDAARSRAGTCTEPAPRVSLDEADDGYTGELVIWAKPPSSD